MGNTYGLSRRVRIWPGDFIGRLRDLCWSTFLWGCSEKNCLVFYLQNVSLAAEVLEDEWKEGMVVLTMQYVDLHLVSHFQHGSLILIWPSLILTYVGLSKVSLAGLSRG